MTRPAESYRAQRRNGLDHECKAKKMVFKRLITKWRGHWNCYPEIAMRDASGVKVIRRWNKAWGIFKGFGRRAA